MRHRVYGKHLGRDKNERATLFKGLVQALFTHGTIQTSEIKAKAVKGLVDKVINLAKDKRTEPKVQSYLTNKNLIDRLIKEIVPKLGSRNSGYTSMVKLGTRLGDQAMMVKMSLVGAEKLEPIKKESRKEEKSGKAEKKVSKKTSETKVSAKKPVRKTQSKAKGNSKSSKK